jgi:hypothetical protein
VIYSVHEKSEEYFKHRIPLKKIKDIFLEAIDKAVKDGILEEQNKQK